jgi:2-keto-4-pentenoate hydratase/2-oxohepta-3-ene-1,7-dioic acid hydratase in catechol pathway
MASHSHWLRFDDAGTPGFGAVEGDSVRVFSGNLFAAPTRTDRVLALRDLAWLPPVQPSKVIALWNNFHALGAKLNLAAPPEPLYFIKTPNTYLAPHATIRAPAAAVGKVVFEGELGIVIGRACTRVSEARALDHVFGYTCANDVTAVDVLNRDASFAQWTRAKGFDTFCPFGPVVATGLDPATLVVRTVLNDQVRQEFPISDMRFTVAQLVSLISHDMTLYPGDMILSGTSIGAGSMKPGSTISVEIAGIGTLTNRFDV